MASTVHVDYLIGLSCGVPRFICFLRPARLRTPLLGYGAPHLNASRTPSLLDIGVGEVQQFATDLGRTVSGKTVVNILSAMFAVLRYAERCGMKVAKVGFTDLQLGSTEPETPVAFFTRDQVHDIIASAEEPFKTLFSLAWYTGCRAGELLP